MHNYSALRLHGRFGTGLPPQPGGGALRAVWHT